MFRSVSTSVWLSVAIVHWTHLCVTADGKGVLLTAVLLLLNRRVVPSCMRPSYGYRCHLTCGVNLTATHGTIFSPGFDEGIPYNNSDDCNWDIVPQIENSSVHIVFNSFDIEAFYDFLTIHSDPPMYSTFVAEYHGSQLPYDLLYEGPLRLHFTSDGSVTRTGFNLSYTIVAGIPPRFLSYAEDIDVVKGEKVVLPCNVTGFPQPEVTWYKDGLEVHSVLRSKFAFSGNDLIIDDVSEEDSGFFKCKAQNHLTSAEQISQLNVYVHPVILIHPTSIHLDTIFNTSGYNSYNNYVYYRHIQYISGVIAVFRCEAYGVPKPDIHWKKDGRDLFYFETRNDWLVISPVRKSDEGHYSCFVNNSIGSTESTIASLTIGNTLPCCFRLGLDSYFFPLLGRTASISFKFPYSGYIVSNVTITKDGYHYQPLYKPFVGYITIYHQQAAVNDTGVYGYHVTLVSRSNSTLPKTMTASSYVPIVVQVNVPPHVTVRPSNVTLRDFDDRLHISCSVHSLQSSYTIFWFKDNMPMYSKNTITRSGLTRAYLSVDNTPDDVSHYTCEAVNSFGLRSHATVSVVFRVEEGGWSWWMETLPCSVTCGFTQGVRYRSRQCYNETGRCPGTSIQRTTCYSSLLYCPSDDIVIYTSPTTMTVDYNTTSNDTWSHSTVTSTTKLAKLKTCDCTGSSQPSVITVAAISGVVTGIIAAAISTVVTYYCVNRRNQKREQKEIPLEALQENAASTSRAESVRYVTTETCPQKSVKTPTAEASLNVQANEKPSVKYSKNAGQVYQEPVGAPVHYMHMLPSELQTVKESAHYQKTEYTKPIPREKSFGEDSYVPMNLGRDHGGDEEGMHYSNPGFSNAPYDKQVYANQ